MDLLRPVLVALGAWVAGSVAAALVQTMWAGLAQLQSTTGKALWVVLPQLLVGLATTTAAAYAHRRPERYDRRRHALAVLFPAAVLIFVQALLNLAGATEMWAAATAIVAESVGALAGWLLVSRVLRRQEYAEATGHGYFR